MKPERRNNVVIKINCVATMMILILGVVPSAYAHSFDYQHGYNAGQQSGRNRVLGLGFTCEGYNFNDCAAAYSDGFFSLCKPLMSNDTQGCYDDADGYEYGYKIGKQDAVSSLNNPVGSCSAIGDTATQQEIDSCYHLEIRYCSIDITRFLDSHKHFIVNYDPIPL
ncbi:MAG: hypothetical protein WAK17_25555 [Candidatus Nitrosopolaris sp.]